MGRDRAFKLRTHMIYAAKPQAQAGGNLVCMHASRTAHTSCGAPAPHRAHKKMCKRDAGCTGQGIYTHSCGAVSCNAFSPPHGACRPPQRRVRLCSIAPQAALPVSCNACSPPHGACWPPQRRVRSCSATPQAAWLQRSLCAWPPWRSSRSPFDLCMCVSESQQIVAALKQSKPAHAHLKQRIIVAPHCCNLCSRQALTGGTYFSCKDYKRTSRCLVFVPEHAEKHQHQHQQHT